MHDARAGLALQEHLGQQADEVVALDEPALLIEEEAAVVVPVPGQADVRACLAHGLGGDGAFSSSMGLGTPFGKVPSGSWLSLMNSNGRCGSSASTISPAPPLPAFTTTFSGRSAAAVDVAQQVLEVLRPDVQRTLAAAPARLRRQARRLNERRACPSARCRR